jgi:hypothetical protein
MDGKRLRKSLPSSRIDFSRRGSVDPFLGLDAVADVFMRFSVGLSLTSREEFRFGFASCRLTSASFELSLGDCAGVLVDAPPRMEPRELESFGILVSILRMNTWMGYEKK